MKITLTILALVLTSLTFSGQNYKQVKIYLDNKSEVQNLLLMGMEFDHFTFEKDNSIITFISDDEFNLLTNSSYSFDVIIDDWKTYYESLPKLSESEQAEAINNSIEQFGVEGLTFGSMGGYYTYPEIVAQLDTMYANFPNLITQKYSIGTSHEGRTIWAVKISDNPNVSENEPQTFFDALIHAREAASMTTVIYYMYYLLENYGTDPEVTYLVDNREIFFVPCVNPDGYEYNRSTNPNGGGMWRKNRRVNGGGYYGVDLNRNYGYKWGYDNIGSSGTPSSETYRGPSAFSEPEAQAVRDFIIGKNVRTYINYHTFGNVIIFPWGYTNLQTPDSLTFRQYAGDMSIWNGYEYGTTYTTLGYTSNGTVRDWMYGEQTVKDKIFGYVFEVGSSSDYFWAPQSRIFPIAQENLRPNLYNTWVAGAYVSVVGADYSSQYFNAGDNISLNPIIKNKGLSTGYNIGIELNSGSTLVTIVTGTTSIDSINANSTSSAANSLTFSVSSSAVPGEEASLIFNTLIDGIIMSRDTLNIIIGTPILLFSDNENDPAVMWNLAGTPAAAKWEATTASFYSTPNSYTDSKNGNYLSNTNIKMTTKDPIDLTNSSLPKLTFWTKYSIENNWDCGQVFASTNGGTTWTALEGNYTVPGSGSGTQVSGQPVYEGELPNWTYEEIDLSAYEGSSILLRFEFKTDGSVVRDGWYVDDIKIFYYGAVPVELTAFNISTSENSVLLNWTTATELNNSGFEILKSTDKINWEKTAFVDGQGTTSEIQHYSFIDKTPSEGKSYYRLDQIDYDGTRSTVASGEIFTAPVYEYALEQNYP
jgi:carboxypeptidase T